MTAEKRSAEKGEHLLPREARIKQAAKIIIKCCRHRIERRTCIDRVANILDWHEFVCDGNRVLRLLQNTRRKDDQVLAWLRKGQNLLENLPSYPLGFETFRKEVKRWFTVYQEIDRSRLAGTPKPFAYEKLFAAEAALHLCDEFNVKLTKTKGGAFCTLAATIYGEPTADLQKQCSKVLSPNYKTWLARRGADPERK